MHIGWIDFSEKDRRTALDVMLIGMQQGTVDELGTGIISEAFSNYFFPGTSTIQTRAKYFFLVPYAMQETIRQKTVKRPEDALRVLDNTEEQTAVLLSSNCKNETGIIGQDNIQHNKWVKRSPSSIYWTGLRTLGFFNTPMGLNPSISEYLRMEIAQRGNLKSNVDDNLCDDIDRDDIDAGHSMYNEYWNLPYNFNWREKLKIELSSDEATFFAEKIKTNKKGTLLDFLLKEECGTDASSFADMAKALMYKIPNKLRSMMQLALNFDGLFYLGTILFNLELSEDQNEQALKEWEFYRPKASTMAERVDLKLIFNSLHIHNDKEYTFLKDLLACFIDNTDESIKKARCLIACRSKALKGGNSKLCRKKEFDNQTWSGGGHQDYRYRNAKIILEDIKRGLKDA